MKSLWISLIYVEDMNYNFQADDEGSTPFIRYLRSFLIQEAFFILTRVVKGVEPG